LERYLAELNDESKPLVLSQLADLSSLSPEELAIFRGAWARIGVARQRQVIHHLVELAEMDCRLNFDDVFRVCLGDSDEMVRAKSIEGLWECESRSLIDAYIDLLREDGSEMVRAAAAMALGRFALLAELEKLRQGDGAKVADALFAAIDDDRERLEVKRRAIEAISPLSLPRVKEIIGEAYESDNVSMRVGAIYAMGRNGDPAWLPVLLQELGSLDAEMRFEAAVACGEMGDGGAVPHLAGLIHDADSQVKLSAIAALGEIGGDEAEEVLRECLSYHDEQVAAAAAEALEELEVSEDPLSFRIE